MATRTTNVIPFPRVSRAFEAAGYSRLFEDFRPSHQSLNSDLEAVLITLVSKSRALEQNSDMMRRYLQLVVTHIVGPNGFKLQVKGMLRSGRPDSKNNTRVEQAFKRFARSAGADLNLRFGFWDLIRVAVRGLARDGEMLLRIHDDLPANRRHPFGFALELLDPIRINHLIRRDEKNGNRVRLGVELDGDNAPVALWLVESNKDHTTAYGGMSATRYPIDDFLHVFKADQPEQLRGYPWATSGMNTLHQLDRYQEAAITAARMGANKGGFFQEKEAGASKALASDQIGDQLVTDSEPGHYTPLPEGVEFVPYDPTYPHELYAEFTKAHQRLFAAGRGISYHQLTGDLTDVNFSSIRSGELESREQWQMDQSLVADNLLTPIYERWLRRALSIGVLDVRGISPADAYERFIDHDWQGRRWSWVDPSSDVKAATTAIENRLKSHKQCAAEQGMDVEDVLRDESEFNLLLAEYGLRPTLDQLTTTSA